MNQLYRCVSSILTQSESLYPFIAKVWTTSTLISQNSAWGFIEGFFRWALVNSIVILWHSFESLAEDLVPSSFLHFRKCRTVQQPRPLLFFCPTIWHDPHVLSGAQFKTKLTLFHWSFPLSVLNINNYLLPTRTAVPRNFASNIASSWLVGLCSTSRH